MTNATSANTGEHSPLVTADWLAARLADTRLRILDIRSVVDGGGYTAFMAAHVPAAIYTDYTRDGWRAARGLVTGLLPAAGALAQLFGRLGIAPRHHVVIVGGGNGAADFSAAARVYWTLKTAGHDAVSILDGGMAAWGAEPMRPVESGEARPPIATVYPVAVDSTWHSDLAAVVAAVDEGEAFLLDSRAADFFQGLKKSPQATRAGRLPGAGLLDHTAAFGPDGRLRPLAELSALFAVVPEGAVIHYCNTGQQAAANWFIMSELLRRPAMTLYDGSMAEWTEEPQRPVAIG